MRPSRFEAGIFAGALAAMLLVFFPMRLAVPSDALGTFGFSAREVRGSVWAGRFVDTRLGDEMVGDLRASLSPLSLLKGEARFAFRDESDSRRIDLVSSFRGSGVENVDLAVPVRKMFAPLPVESLQLEGVTARFSDGACVEATGRAHASVGQTVFAGVPLPQALSGNLRCDGDALSVPLQSQSGMERLTLKIRGDATYRLSFAIPEASPALGAALLGVGFKQVGNGYIFSENGHF